MMAYFKAYVPRTAGKITNTLQSFRAPPQWPSKSQCYSYGITLSVERTMTEVKEDKYLNSMTFVAREQWKARKAKTRRPIRTPVSYVHFTYTASLPCESKKECVERVQNVQICSMVSCKLPDLRSNFMIGGDGRVYEGRGWKYAPERPVQGNRMEPLTDKYIEIAFISRDDEKPTKSMQKAATALVEEGIEKNILSKNVKVLTIWKDFTIPSGVRKMKDVEVVDAPPFKEFNGIS